MAPALAALASHAPARPIVDDPYEAMLRALPALYPRRARHAEIHPTAILAPGAQLGRDVAIGPYAVIGAGAALGDRVTVEAHSVIGEAAHVGDDSGWLPSVTVYPNARIGKRVRLHSAVHWDLNAGKSWQTPWRRPSSTSATVVLVDVASGVYANSAWISSLSPWAVVNASSGDRGRRGSASTPSSGRESGETVQGSHGAPVGRAAAAARPAARMDRPAGS